jgi:hypothetical protein
MIYNACDKHVMGVVSGNNKMVPRDLQVISTAGLFFSLRCVSAPLDCDGVRRHVCQD